MWDKIANDEKSKYSIKSKIFIFAKMLGRINFFSPFALVSLSRHK